MAVLNYDIPFNPFTNMSFLSCVAGVHTYLDMPRAKTERPNAWDYGTKPGNIQEDWYFTLGTLSGRNSAIEPFDAPENSSRDQTAYADFCFKLCGYSYTVLSNDIVRAAEESVSNGFPAIAKTNIKDECRVVIGAEGGGLIFADKDGKPDENPNILPDDIAGIYVISDRVEPEYTLLDGLENMERSLSHSIETGWKDIRAHFPQDYETWNKMYRNEDFGKTKAAFERLLSLMWNFDHCHNVSSCFAHKVYAPLCDDRIAHLCRRIDGAYYDAHNTQWAMQALYDLRDWNKREWYSKELGMFMFADMGLERLENDDRAVLDSVREMIRILEK